MPQNFPFIGIHYNLLDHLAEGYQIIDFDYKFLFVNKSALIQSQFESKEQLLGYSLFEKYPGIENLPLFEKIEQAMANRTFEQITTEFKFNNGTTSWFELFISPVPSGVAIMSVNLEDQKRLDLEQLKDLESLDEILFVISHKLRQPVCNIDGLLTILDGDIIDREDFLPIIKYVKVELERLKEYTEEMTEIVSSKRFINAQERSATSRK
ncbi:PAS domain-containing protein [Persicobacter psychrovividus]|uniref:histidine kinase n=1 Tax=Persicobacter psychrovividus TaxID=387638 RepID=A0ABM7VLP2_9BACT|nr:hypothetical protein PEPS_41820 [Persicobacter psychrovividus]